MIQDREGFCWIATQNGLNRFDGTSFKTFHNKSNDTTSLSHNHCTSIVEDKNGDLWIGTFRGLSKYIKKQNRFTQIQLHHPAQSREAANIIRDITTDRTGNIWIAGAALWKLDPAQNTTTIYLPGGPGTISGNHTIFDLTYDDSRQGLWFSAGDLLNYYSFQKDTFFSPDYNPYQWKIFELNELRSPVLDAENRVWCFDQHSNHLLSFDAEENEIQTTYHVATTAFRKLVTDHHDRIWINDWAGRAEIVDLRTLMPVTGYLEEFHPTRNSNAFVRGVFHDKENNYWIASIEGLHIYNESRQFYIKHIIHPAGERKSPLYIYSMAQLTASKLSVATNEGLFEYNLDTKQTRRLGSGQRFTKILAQYADEHFLYFGSQDGQLCRMDLRNNSVDKLFKLETDIIFIKKRNDHELWFGYWNSGLCRLDLKTNQVQQFTSSSQPVSLTSNAIVSGSLNNDEIWIGYNADHGFSKLDISSLQVEHFHPSRANNQFINCGTVTVISKGSGDSFWIGSFGGGLFHFDPALTSYKHYGQEHGLSSNYIHSILPDQAGYIWVSTADGLDWLNPITDHITHVDISLSSSSNDVNPNGMSGMNDKLYFFGNDYIIELDPAIYLSIQDSIHMVVSQFKVFDQEMAIDPANPILKLSYDQNFFTFEYSAIRANPHKEIHYAYRLTGFDAAWNDAGNKNFASYTNVPAGKYEFQVRAMNRDGQWTTSLLHIPVHIRPPYWQTWWFMMSVVSIVTLGLYSLYRYRINHIRKIYSIKSRISQDLHDDVGASLSSIHIFSSVAEEAIHHNPQKAENIVRQIKINSRQVMENMSDIIWAMNAEQQDNESLVGRIKNYGYDLLSQKNIACLYQINPLVEKKLQKPEARKNVLLIVKEALNNIAKYSEASQAQVNIELDHSSLIITIQDNGKGFDLNQMNGGNGLKNMHQRASSLGGSCLVHSAAGEGTRIEAKIPVANISDS